MYLLAITIFGQGKPTQVVQFKQDFLDSWQIPEPTRPQWVHLFVQNFLEVQKSPTCKIWIGGMITILVWNHGIEYSEGCTSLATSANIRYDYATLCRVKFFYSKRNQGPYLVCPNGRTFSLPPQPDTLFDIHENDDVHGLTMTVI